MNIIVHMVKTYRLMPHPRYFYMLLYTSRKKVLPVQRKTTFPFHPIFYTFLKIF